MGVLTVIFNTLIVLTSLFLICLILIQRGKGGGLAGAFGGVGGSSAFGTKAGDIFTRITVVTAAVWILLAMLLVVLTNRKPASGLRAPSAADVGCPRSLARRQSHGTRRRAPSSGSPLAGRVLPPAPAPAIPARDPPSRRPPAIGLEAPRRSSGAVRSTQAGSASATRLVDRTAPVGRGSRTRPA